MMKDQGRKWGDPDKGEVALWGTNEVTAVLGIVISL
jgi:hypothetical protein